MSIKNIPIHLWYGGDTYSIYESLNFWKKSFREKYNNLNVLTYSESDYNLEHTVKLLGHSVNSQSLFGETKLVILKNLLSSKKIHPEVERSVLTILDKPATTTFVLFIQTEKIENKKLHDAIKKLEKRMVASVKEYPLPQTTATLAAWVASYAKKKTITIDRTSINVLIEKTVDVGGYRPVIDTSMLWNLAEELNKLHAYTGGKRVDEKAILAMERVLHQDALWDLLNALLSGNKKTSASLLHKRLEATSLANHAAELRTLLTLFAGQVKTLLAAKRLSPTAFAAYAKKTKMSQGKQYMVTKQAHTLTEERLKELQQKILTLFITSVESPKVLKAQFVLFLL